MKKTCDAARRRDAPWRARARPRPWARAPFPRSAARGLQQRPSAWACSRQRRGYDVQGPLRLRERLGRAHRARHRRRRLSATGRRAAAAAFRERGHGPLREHADSGPRSRRGGHRGAHVRREHRGPDDARHRGGYDARAHRQRAGLRPHRELRQGGLHAGVGRRRRSCRGGGPDSPERPAVARRVRVRGVEERQLPGHSRHRARQRRHALVGRRRRCGRLPPHRGPARSPARRQHGQRRG